jgi:Cytochrome c.
MSSSITKFPRGLKGVGALVLASVLTLPIVACAKHAGSDSSAASGKSHQVDYALQKHPVGYYSYGKTPTKEQIAAWNIDIGIDGENYPPGKGTVSQGEDIYAKECAMCHGDFGEGKGLYPKLIGGSKADLQGNPPTKTLGGNFGPYASTLFDYIHRAMPYFAPQSLTPSEVYALSAFILNGNGIVPSDFVADAQSMSKIKMPNQDGFIYPDPRPDTHNTECMKNCVTAKQLKVGTDAADLGTTPPTTGPLKN